MITNGVTHCRMMIRKYERPARQSSFLGMRNDIDHEADCLNRRPSGT